MKRVVGILLLALILGGCNNQPEKQEESEQEVERKETPKVDAVKTMSLEEYDEFLAAKKSGIVYFGWITRCGDSLNFQENYLEQLLIDHPQLDDDFYIVNLDVEAPDALIERELREPLTEKYDVTFSPTLLNVKEGVTIDKIEWTLKESDPETAISRTVLDKFFEDSGYLK